MDHTPVSTPFPLRRQFYSTSSIADFVNTDPVSPTRYSPGHKTGRKTYKSLKEKKEAVWPDFLEEALLEALERYRPTSSKDPRLLRRFPKRNAFISNYIKQKTGKHRTPKQVGSRLQQLRETCTEERVIRLICSRDFDAPDRIAAVQAKPIPELKPIPDLRINTALPLSSSPSSGTESGVAPSLSVESLTLVDPYDYPVTPYSDDFEHRSSQPAVTNGTSWPHAYVHIDLVPSGEHYGTGTNDFATSFTLDLDESGLTDSPVLTGPDAWKWQRRISVQTALPACYYTPTVTVSSSILKSEGHYESCFRVQRDHKVLAEESTELERVSEGHTRPSLFRTKLLPHSWGTISTKVSDLRQCVVLQDIYEVFKGAERSRDPVYSIIYNFDGSYALEHGDVSYYASAYQLTPIQDERIPLAPILANSPCSPDILHYDYDDVSLLPPIATPLVGVQAPTSQWISPAYLSNSSYYPATSFAIGQEQSGGFLENEQLGYPSLYPF